MHKLATDPRRVEMFVRAVELGSFSALARAWRIKPSSVSRQIGALEQELGVRLLARTTRRITLTEAGIALFEGAKESLDQLDEACRAAAEFTSSPRGRIRLSTPVTFGRRYVGPLLADLLERYPGLELEIAFHDRFVDVVREGYDVAIRAGHVRDEGLVARTLADNERVLVASPEYLAREGEPKVPSDLRTHSCLVFRYVDATDAWRFRQGGVVETVVVTGPVASNNGDLLVDSAVAGLGVVLAPRWLVADVLAAAQVRRLLATYEVTATDFDSKVNLLYPSRRFLPGKVRVFCDFLVERFTPPPWER